MNISFRKFIENIESVPGMVKVFSNPLEQGSNLTYTIRYFLKPKEKIMLKIPEEYQGMIIRDMILAHRKSPTTINQLYKKDAQGNPMDMRWEAAKNKWRDFYGGYTEIQAHDKDSGQWHTYVDNYGMPYKFAEIREDFENETLHDWMKQAKIKPDAIVLSNPGNRRASTNPVTGEKVDPFDPRSTVEINDLKIIFLPNSDLVTGGVQYYERIYSKKGGPADNATKFTNYASANSTELEPAYGNYGSGIYPNALVLAADWGRQSTRIKQLDGGWYFVASEEAFKHVASEIGNRHTRANAGGETAYSHNGRNFVKVFPVTLNPGPGANIENGNELKIGMTKELIGRQLMQVEVMCGDTEFRPDRAADGRSWKRLGDAKLKIAYTSKGNEITLSENIPVAPQMVAAAAPKSQIAMAEGDMVTITSKQDTTYVMGWRIAYK